MSHVSRGTVTKSAPATDPKQVHRLTEMEVEEVSLVDRAANKKKFLVVKREQPMSTEVTSNGKGGFTSTGTANKGAKTPQAKAAMEVPPGFKEAAAPLLDRAITSLGDLSASLKGSKAAEIGEEGELPGVPAEFSAQATKVIDLLNKLCSMWPTAPADAAAEGDPEGDPPEEPSEMQMRLAEKAFVDAGALLKRAGVKKVGAKMSKDRLTRLQQTAAVLTNLISELAPDTSADPAGAPAPGGAAPELGKGMPPKKKDDEEKAKATKVDEALSAIGQAITKMSGGLTALATTVQAQGATIVGIQKSRGVPNALSAEGSGSSEVEQPVSWPMDMNRPITRDNVAKVDSFFDND